MTSASGPATIRWSSKRSRKKPAVLHYGSGLVDLGVAGKTYYYSRTRLETSGTVSVDGRLPCPSTAYPGWTTSGGDFTTMGIGWDWLSLNLDDGSDLTVSVVWGTGRAQAHQHLRHLRPPPTLRLIHLPGSDITLESTGTWTSSVTGAVYPVNWNLRVDSLDLDLTLTPTIVRGRIRTERIHPRDLLGGGPSRRWGPGKERPWQAQVSWKMVGYAPAPEAPTTPRQSSPDRSAASCGVNAGCQDGKRCPTLADHLHLNAILLPCSSRTPMPAPGPKGRSSLLTT